MSTRAVYFVRALNEALCVRPGLFELKGALSMAGSVTQQRIGEDFCVACLDVYGLPFAKSNKS